MTSSHSGKKEKIVFAFQEGASESPFAVCSKRLCGINFASPPGRRVLYNDPKISRINVRRSLSIARLLMFVEVKFYKALPGIELGENAPSLNGV